MDIGLEYRTVSNGFENYKSANNSKLEMKNY